MADKYIQDKTEQDFENVLSVKLDGLLSLLSTNNIDNLKYLVLFSSVAGFYGNVGQTDYAIANEILSKAAHLAKMNHPDLHVTAINWGAWDSGMVSDALKAQFEAYGVKLVSSQGGAARMVQLFDRRYTSEAQLIIGDTLPAAISYLDRPLSTHKILKNIDLRHFPFLADHSIKGAPVWPFVHSIAWMKNAAQSLYPEFKNYAIQNIQMLKGIVLDGKQAPAYKLTLIEKEKNKDTIVFEAQITSQGKKLPVFHSKAKIILKHKNIFPASPVTQATLPDFHNWEGMETVYTDGSLFHGPAYQGIRKIISSTKEEMWLACYISRPYQKERTSPAFSLEDQGPGSSSLSKGLLPASHDAQILDVQYQALVVWTQHYCNGHKSLPASTAQITQFSPLTPNTAYFLHLKNIKTNGHFAQADCAWINAHTGNIAVECDNIKVTISETLSWD